MAPKIDPSAVADAVVAEASAPDGAAVTGTDATVVDRTAPDVVAVVESPEPAAVVADPEPAAVAEAVVDTGTAIDVTVVPDTSVEALVRDLIVEPIQNLPTSQVGEDEVCVIVKGPALGRWRARRLFGPEEVFIPENDLSAAELEDLAGDAELTLRLGVKPKAAVSL